jgi:hypothetical protein
MDPVLCRHQYRLSFGSFFLEFFPLGTKVCDHCGCEIHLGWRWRLLAVFTTCLLLFLFIILYLHFDPMLREFKFFLLIRFAAYLTVIFIQTTIYFLIVRYGKYVLKARKGRTLPK